MAFSMTGFGKGHKTFEQLDISVEIRSVNNRFQELFIRLPKSHQFYEFDIRDRVSKSIKRGKINVNVQIVGLNGNTESLKINKERVKEYYDSLNEINKTLNFSDPVTLQDLLKFDDIFNQDDLALKDDITKNQILEVAQIAIDDFNEMRKLEGIELQKDLIQRNDNLDRQLEKVKELNTNISRKEFEKMCERLRDNIFNKEVDRDRLELELAILADRSDITEECVRMDSHIKLFKAELKKDVSGKRLNFILQEMNRETNTMGSKSPVIEISHTIVAMKEEIEKMREQVQNLE